MNKNKSHFCFVLFCFVLFLPTKVSRNCFLFPDRFTQALVVWDSCGKTLFGDLEKIHVRAAKIIFGLNSGTRQATRC